MTKGQILAIAGALLLFVGLYLGFDTKPDSQRRLERARALQAESTGLDQLIEDAKAHISASEASEIQSLEAALASVSDDTARIGLLRRLSGVWYRAGQQPVAGAYAEQVAELENTDAAWSVSGATFFNALVAATDPTLRRYTAEHARKAFESAASLNPEKVEHRVNLALVYAEEPSPENPMQAVLMLRDLEQKFPTSPAVYNALGRLAIKTNQWERAVERLEKAYSLDPENPNTPCLLAKAYQGLGNTDKANAFAEKCNQRN